MRMIKVIIVVMSIVTAWDAYECYVNFTPINVIWLLVASHVLMFYVMMFFFDFIFTEKLHNQSRRTKKLNARERYNYLLKRRGKPWTPKRKCDKCGAIARSYVVSIKGKITCPGCCSESRITGVYFDDYYKG